MFRRVELIGREPYVALAALGGCDADAWADLTQHGAGHSSDRCGTVHPHRPEVATLRSAAPRLSDQNLAVTQNFSVAHE
jgi:hypothetical protein